MENHIKELSKRHEIYLYSIDIDESIADCFGIQYNPELISSLSAYVGVERRFKDPRSSNGWYPLYRRVKNRGRGIRWLKMNIKSKDLDLIDKAAAKIGRCFRSDKCDVAIGYIDKFTQVPLPLAKTTMPTVFFCVEPNRSIYDGGNLKGLLVGKPDRFTKKLVSMDQRLGSSVTQFACNSLYTRDSIYHAYGRLAWVIPSGVDVTTFRPDPQIKKENLVLSVGVLMGHKAPEFLLHSVVCIEEQYRPRVAFVYPRGSETMRGMLQRFADSWRLDIEFHSRVETRDLVKLYNRASVCAYPAIMEPGGLVPLEAQASATPVVAVNEGGNREEIIDKVTGFLTDRDPQEFGAAIERVLRDEKLAIKMGEAGAAWVRSERTWNKIVPQFEQCLQTLLNPCSPP